MGTTPEAILARLEPGAETPTGSVRGLSAVLDALIADGLVSVRRDGRRAWVRLTADGEARRAGAAVGPRRRATTVRPRGRTEAGEDLAARVEALEARVAALTAQVQALAGRHGVGDGDGDGDGGGVRDGDGGRDGVRDREGLDAAILECVADLDARLRLGGIVPIPDLRDHLRDRGLGADDAAVTSALERLERAWKIDLAAAQAPAQVANRRAGIERPGRGLLYYIARR
jgi:hypothetical protein